MPAGDTTLMTCCHDAAAPDIRILIFIRSALHHTGGPGHEGPRPSEASAWIKAAVNHFRVLLMDQRGTGRSAAITAASLVRRGTPKQQAEYLTYFRLASCSAVPWSLGLLWHLSDGVVRCRSRFAGVPQDVQAVCNVMGATMPHRADSIVRDAEIVREALVPKDTLGGRWTILGQSFGGFCCVTYLSIAPQGGPQTKPSLLAA